MIGASTFPHPTDREKKRGPAGPLDVGGSSNPLFTFPDLTTPTADQSGQEIRYGQTGSWGAGAGELIMRSVFAWAMLTGAHAWAVDTLKPRSPTAAKLARTLKAFFVFIATYLLIVG
jgi:hypothetical protein